MATDSTDKNHALVTASTSTRVERTNALVDSEVHKVLEDLEVLASDYDALIDILKDRMIESTDASFPIALARLGELRMDINKKRIDILKTLVNDKGIELAAKKKSPPTDLESILNGAALGAALGAQLSGGNLNTQQNNPAFTIIDVSEESSEHSTIEHSADEIIKDSKSV